MSEIYQPFTIIKIIANSYELDPLNLKFIDSNCIFYRNIDDAFIKSMLTEVIGTFDVYFDKKYIDLIEYNICCSKLNNLYESSINQGIPIYFLDNLYFILKNILPNRLNFNLYTFEHIPNKSLFYVLEPIFINDKESLLHNIAYIVYNIVYTNWFLKKVSFLNQ